MLHQLKWRSKCERVRKKKKKKRNSPCVYYRKQSGIDMGGQKCTIQKHSIYSRLPYSHNMASRYACLEPYARPKNKKKNNSSLNSIPESEASACYERWIKQTHEKNEKNIHFKQMRINIWTNHSNKTKNQCESIRLKSRPNRSQMIWTINQRMWYESLGRKNEIEISNAWQHLLSAIVFIFFLMSKLGFSLSLSSFCFLFCLNFSLFELWHDEDRSIHFVYRFKLCYLVCKWTVEHLSIVSMFDDKQTAEWNWRN